MQKKPKNFVQLSELPKTQGWKTKEGKVVPFSSLSNEELQDALQHAEKREMLYHNKSSFFGAIVEKLEEEASSRGLELMHYESEFSQKNAQARQGFRNDKLEEHDKES